MAVVRDCSISMTHTRLKKKNTAKESVKWACFQWLCSNRMKQWGSAKLSTTSPSLACPWLKCSQHTLRPEVVLYTRRSFFSLEKSWTRGPKLVLQSTKKMYMPWVLDEDDGDGMFILLQCQSNDNSTLAARFQMRSKRIKYLVTVYWSDLRISRLVFLLRGSLSSYLIFLLTLYLSTWPMSMYRPRSLPTQQRRCSYDLS